MEMLDRWPHASHRRTASRQKPPEPLPARLWGVVARPAGMRRATHGRLVRKHNRLLQRLQLVPYRPSPNESASGSRPGCGISCGGSGVGFDFRNPSRVDGGGMRSPARRTFSGSLRGRCCAGRRQVASRRGRPLVAIAASAPETSPVFGRRCRRDEAAACVPAAPPVPCASAWGWAASGTSHDASTSSPLEAVCRGAAR
jgi:hypothetical protein